MMDETVDPDNDDYQPTIFEDYSGQLNDIAVDVYALPNTDLNITVRDTAGAHLYDERQCS